nr:Uma2 family endonuclease [uncultured Acetatifactor sp.]
MYRVFPDNVQYTWWFGYEKETVIPDVSLNCQVRLRRGNTFANAPQFVTEILSDSTEKYDRMEKKDIYRKEEINEYWIADWQKRKSKFIIRTTTKTGTRSIIFSRQ